VPVLPDGNYDVIVVDAERDENGALHIELTISLGPHVGDVIRLRERHIERGDDATADDDEFALLGVPGTLRIRAGEPRFRPETR
jgi:hypothetical protein